MCIRDSWQGGALPDELQPHIPFISLLAYRLKARFIISGDVPSVNTFLSFFANFSEIQKTDGTHRRFSLSLFLFSFSVHPDLFVLAAARTIEQMLDRLLRRHAAVQHGIHRFGDRHGHALLLCKMIARLGRVIALDRCTDQMCIRDSVPLR